MPSANRSSGPPIIHKVLFTWISVLIFLIFLVLRLDEQITWNWLLVFIPMWLYDIVMIMYVLFYIVIWYRGGTQNDEPISIPRKVWHLIAVVLKMLFQILLCLRLQDVVNIPSYCVALPFWILFIVMIGDFTRALVPANQSRNENDDWSENNEIRLRRRSIGHQRQTQT